MVPHNELKRKLVTGEVAFGAQTTTHSPETIELFGNLGFSFVWVDLENVGASALDAKSVTPMVRGAACAGTNLLIRPHDINGPTIRKLLDTGVRNVILPRVETAAEIREAISATRFAYDGKAGNRGSSSVSRVNGWGATDQFNESREDDSVVVGAMIENKSAVDNIDEILSVPELGFVRIGYNDLAISVGRPGDSNHPEVHRLAKKTEAAARDHGIPLSGKATDQQEVAKSIEEGYRLITLGNDLSVLQSVFSERRIDAKEAVE